MHHRADATQGSLKRLWIVQASHPARKAQLGRKGLEFGPVPSGQDRPMTT
jgi:hypothetical protein